MILLSVLFFFMRAFISRRLAKWVCHQVFWFGHRNDRLHDLFALVFRLLLWGFILDSYPGTLGYALMFGILGVMALFAAVAHRLHRRIVSGTAQRMGHQCAGY